MGVKDRIDASSNWILNSQESLVILLLMGTGLTMLFFGILALVMLFNRSAWGFLFGFFSFGVGKQFFNIFKMVKKLGLKNALGGWTANEFVWHKNKYGGYEDGDSRHKGDEICSKGDAEENGRIGEEIRHIYQ